MSAVEPQRLAELTWTVGEFSQLSSSPSPFHEFDTELGSDGANQDGVRLAGLSGDHVEVPVHPVNEEQVGVACLAEHGFGALSTPTFVAVRGAILGTSISFGFHDDAAARPLRSLVDEQLADTFPRDHEDRACIEATRQRFEESGGASLQNPRSLPPW